MASTTTVPRLYGRWRSQLALSLPDQLLPATVHTYSAPSPLPANIRFGDRVQVIALSPVVYRTLRTQSGSPVFDVYDPQIIGVVEGVRRFGEEQVALLVKNERIEHGVEWAVVSAPLVAGEAPNVVEDGPLAEWAKRLLDSEGRVAGLRCVDVVVVDELGEDVTLPVKCRYPDPKVRRRERRITDVAGAWKPYAT
ncbi:hypothetical protein C8T65DRAFT_751040 [Cerioporus squamosus]|nr:hypothetical protein C8T65DRAFT_751040 [Cerioporus squamosus]